MKMTAISVKHTLLSLMIVGTTAAMSCSWEILDPLSEPTNMFSGTYSFENSWWHDKVTIESYVDARSNEIYAFWMEKDIANSPVIIYFHGIGGNLGTYASQIRFLYEDTPFSVFAIDYPESGMSRGTRSEEDLYAAARGALSWVTDEAGLPHDQIVVYGFSLGAALSIKLGAENPDLPVACDGGFTSYGAWMPTISHIRFILPGENKFDNLATIRSADGPKLIIHGTDDRQNPFWMGEALHGAAGNNATFLAVPGAGHMFSSQHRDDNVAIYTQIIAEPENLVLD